MFERKPSLWRTKPFNREVKMGRTHELRLRVAHNSAVKPGDLNGIICKMEVCRKHISTVSVRPNIPNNGTTLACICFIWFSWR